jgi:tRNA(fMet)-specific endonuclease VapC
MWLLDTDHVSILEHSGNPVADRLRRKLRALPEGGFGVSIVSYEEQVRGWLARINQKKTVLDQVAIYRRLRTQLELYCAIDVIEFDEQAAITFQRLRSSKVRVKTMDLKIASIAISLDATLLTRNSIDFIKVPGLRFEDWTKE